MKHENRQLLVKILNEANNQDLVLILHTVLQEFEGRMWLKKLKVV